jgi:CheY-like chemotaxis protein
MNGRSPATAIDDTASRRTALPNHGCLPTGASEPLVGRDDEPWRGMLDGVSVLLVEDDPASRESLEVLLEYYGARTRTAESMRAALSCYDDALPTIVVSDIGLAEGDGCALIRAIRARELGGERTPAIAVSGFPSRETGDRALRAGFNAFLPKPIDIHALFRVVRRLIADS